MGLLLWMSHPAWPSQVWQTYDYYFEPTAAYFGCKKATEPLHIQWSPLTDQIEAVNYHSRGGSGLTASARIGRKQFPGVAESAKSKFEDGNRDKANWRSVEIENIY